MKNPLRIVVVGGNGFLGRHIVKALVDAGDTVSVYDMSPPPAELSDIDYIVGSIADPAHFASAVMGVDVVVFLANNSLPGSANIDLSDEIKAHVQVTVKAAEICNNQGVKRFIFASSGGTVYGYDAHTPLTEDMPTRPLNAYGVSKMSIENYLRLIDKQKDMDTLSLRISNPYGAGQRALRGQGFIAAALQHVLNDKTFTIWGDGTVERDFIYVTDVSDAFVSACHVQDVPDCINIGSGQSTSLKSVLTQIEKTLGKKISIEYETGRNIDVARNVLDISKAKSLLNWHPTMSLKSGLTKTINWWLSSKEA